MKKAIINVLATIGISLILLTAIVRVQGFDLYFTRVVLITVSANVVIHLGLLLTRKFESQYLALGLFVDMAYTTAVLVVHGLIFDMFEVTPIWVLAVMAVLIHLLALSLDIARVRKETSAINKLLKERDEKQGIARKILSQYSRAGEGEGLG